MVWGRFKKKSEKTGFYAILKTDFYFKKYIYGKFGIKKNGFPKLNPKSVDIIIIIKNINQN